MHDPHADYNLSRYPPDRLFPKPLDVEQLLAWLRAVRAAKAPFRAMHAAIGVRLDRRREAPMLGRRQ